MRKGGVEGVWVGQQEESLTKGTECVISCFFLKVV